MTLREPTYLLLTALADARMHGYGLIEEVRRISGGSVILRPGTLYGALDRLQDEGLIRPDGDEVVEGRRRQYYVLTEPGAARLESEANRLRMQSTVALRRLRNRTATA